MNPKQLERSLKVLEQQNILDQELHSHQQQQIKRRTQRKQKEQLEPIVEKSIVDPKATPSSRSNQENKKGKKPIPVKVEAAHQSDNLQTLQEETSARSGSDNLSLDIPKKDSAYFKDEAIEQDKITGMTVQKILQSSHSYPSAESF